MDQVRPLLVWSNLSGLYPLAQHRRHRIVLSLWCLCVFGLQVYDLGFVYYGLYLTLKENSNYPVLNLGAYVFDTILGSVVNFLPRLLCLRYRHFASCFQHLAQYDDIYAGNKVFHGAKNRKTTVIGLVIAVIWLLTSIGFMIPHYGYVSYGNPSLQKPFGFAAAVFSSSQVVLVYYCLFVGVFFISNRIDELTEQLKDLTDSPPDAEVIFMKSAIPYHVDKTSSNFRRKLDTVKNRLNRIRWASDEIVQAFSHFILVMLTNKLISISILVFRTVYWLLKTYSVEDFDGLTLALPLRDISCNFALMFIIFYLADVLTKKMSKFKKSVADFPVSSLRWPEKMELKFLLMEIDLKRVQLSAGGIFGVGKHLLPGIVGTIITYIVILLQSQPTQ